MKSAGVTDPSIYASMHQGIRSESLQICMDIVAEWLSKGAVEAGGLDVAKVKLLTVTVWFLVWRCSGFFIVELRSYQFLFFFFFSNEQLFDGQLLLAATKIYGLLLVENHTPTIYPRVSEYLVL